MAETTYIDVDRKRHTIGYFPELQDAVAARQQAETELHTHNALTC